MNKDKGKREYRKGTRSALVLISCLFAAMLAGCGDSKNATGGSVESSDFIETVKPEGGDIADTAVLVEVLRDAVENTSNMNMGRDGEITGTVVIETGSYPVISRLSYDIDIAEDASRESFSIDVNRNDDSHIRCSFGGETRVLIEGGQSISYVRDDDYNWTKTAGDCLNAKQKIADLFDCLTDIELSVEDNGYGSYGLDGEISGEALKMLAAEYGGLTEEELNASDWDSITANLKLHVDTYGSSCSMSLTIESAGLARVLLSAAEGVQSVEEGSFSLNVHFLSTEEKNEYLSIEEPGAFREEAVGTTERCHADVVSELLDEIYAEELKENFVEIEETTEPVTLYARGEAVTIMIPEGVREEGTLALSAPNRARLTLRNWENYGTYMTSNGGLWADFRLDSGLPETYLEEGRSAYAYREDKGDCANLEFREIGTMRVEMGEAQVISYSYDSDDRHYIYYYAALPLNGNKILCVKLESSEKTEDEGNVCDDDTLKTIFNSCSVGESALRLSGDSDTGSRESAGFASVEELLQDPEIGSYYQDMMKGWDVGVVTLRPDGDNVVYTVTLNPPAIGTTYDQALLRSGFEEMFSGKEYVEAMETLAALIRDSVLAEDPKIIWELYMDDGTEILTKEYGTGNGTFSNQ